jgi:hypothetical protein
MAIWALALLWSTLGSWLMGYDRDGKEVPLVFGMPDWIFWNVLVPWVACFLFALWFCFFCMADDDLGEDQYKGPEHE